MTKNKLKNQLDFMQKNRFIFTYTNYIPFKNKNIYLKEIKPPKAMPSIRYLGT